MLVMGTHDFQLYVESLPAAVAAGRKKKLMMDYPVYCCGLGSGAMSARARSISSLASS